MDQKVRDKIAWVLTVALLPVMIYLMVTNISKARRRAGPAGALPPVVQPVDMAPMAPALSSAGTPAAPAATGGPGARTAGEQKRIAALLPKRNPFDAPQVAKPEPKPVVVPSVPEPKPVAPLVLTGIISQKGADKRTAIIDGKMVKEGEKIDGWTIVKINANDVELVKDGEARTLQIGQK